MVPPSVLASMFPACQSDTKPTVYKASNNSKHASGAKGKRGLGKNSKDQPQQSPQALFQQLLKKKHPFVQIMSDDAKYDSVPSALRNSPALERTL
jgi:hypothetical protein